MVDYTEMDGIIFKTPDGKYTVRPFSQETGTHHKNGGRIYKAKYVVNERGTESTGSIFDTLDKCREYILKQGKYKEEDLPNPLWND
jgi:hypothetical protein